MDSKTYFRGYLRKHFAPLLHSLGFTGKGSNFRRVVGEAIHCVNLQGDKYSGSCAVNLGLHLTFLPIEHSGDLPDIETIEEVSCEFRDRLTPEGVFDYWWKYKCSKSQLIENAEHLIRTYKEQGEPRFAQFASTEQIAEMMTVDDIRLNSAPTGFRFSTTHTVKAALAMARIHFHIGNFEVALEFANAGMEKVESWSPRKAKLQAMIDETARRLAHR
ncbi:MAG: DUF4304 domain-containing protein [Planctomycetaceae bacterium]|nr:DUF4304 domain-containing protein [Planctomycetaceae bacterium]